MARQYEFIKLSGELESVGDVIMAEKTVRYDAATFIDEAGDETYFDWLVLPMRLHKDIEAGVKSVFHIAHCRHKKGNFGTIVALEKADKKRFFQQDTLPLVRQIARASHYPYRAEFLKNPAVIGGIWFILIFPTMFLLGLFHEFIFKLPLWAFPVGGISLSLLFIMWPLLKKDKARLPELLKQLKDNGFAIDG